MERSLKPGTASFRKTKFAVNTCIWVCVILWTITTHTACGALELLNPRPSPTSTLLFPFQTSTPAGGNPKTPVVIVPTLTPTLRPTITPTPKPPISYYTQSGDWLQAVAARFGVAPGDISSVVALPAQGFLPVNQLLLIPDILPETGPAEHLLPDCEILYSPSTVGFDVKSFVNAAGGYLVTYQEYVIDRMMTGAEIVQRVAQDNSINPRLLLALLEYKSGWVYGQPFSTLSYDYPMGWLDVNAKGLNKQLTWAARQLSVGYYRWREGTLTGITFTDNTTQRLAPTLNAGSVALYYYFSVQDTFPQWEIDLFGEKSIITLYEQMFGDPWLLGRAADPLFPPNLIQPYLQLPWRVGQSWSFSGGPHPAWGEQSVFAALDFAPPTEKNDCSPATVPATAMASGLVIRTGPGLVIVDLDGDGYEQTGWVILYLHIATTGKVKQGAWLNTDDPIGYPSCEGGFATGSHVHVARKFNGEWMHADGPLPFMIDGWRARNGARAYEGTLTKDDQLVIASPTGERVSIITRTLVPGP